MKVVPPPAAPRNHSAEPWRGQTYYDQPALRRSHWGWKVGSYIAIGGTAGAAQLIAWLARGLDRGTGGALRRQAHRLGLGASAVGAALLVADLKTPHRFANMLRIFRPTSPMSIGSYVLSGFGLASGIGVLADALAPHLRSRRGRRRARRVAEAAQFPAALTGAGMSVYTAALLSSTSTPLWAAVPRLMGMRFGAAAFASGAAALSLGALMRGEEREAERLDELAALATGAGLLASLLAQARAEAAGVRRGPRDRALGLGAMALGEGLPLLGYAAAAAAPRLGREFSALASLAVIAGNFAMRNEIIHAGNASADRPRDYFRFAQPEHLAQAGAPRRLPGAAAP